jgi:hypothetical protein
MGKYDDLTADLPPVGQMNPSTDGGRFNDLLKDLPPVQNNAERIEPGIYDSSDPVGQRIIENFQKAANGYALGALGGTGIVKAADSTIGQAILNSPKDLSPAYDALHESAGISKDLPVQRGAGLRFPNLAGQPTSAPPTFAPAIAPLTYAKDPNTLLNIARGRMENLGDRLSPQELNDYKTLIGQMIDTGKVGAGKPLAMASQLRAQASELLNNRVEGLAELNKVYALSTKLRNPTEFLPQFIQNGLQKYGPWFARAAAVKLGLDIF